jgi:glycosyltransferase involved in cell wall biosynthesis
MPFDTLAIVTAHQEADRLPATLAALAAAFPGVKVIVADDGSTDGGADVARAAGTEVVRSERTIGKGGIATLAARRALALIEREPADPPPLILLCDGDLAESAGDLPALAGPVRDGEADLTIAIFARKAGGGFGFAVNFSRWATRRKGGLELAAPISGQRVLTVPALRAVLPFAPGYGMETAMNIDAARAGLRVREVELPLAHRATGKTLKGFVHRGRQLRDFMGVYLRR